MIVTTSVSELPVTDPAGTTGPPPPFRRLRETRAGAFSFGGGGNGGGDAGASKPPETSDGSSGDRGSDGDSVGGPVGLSNDLDMAMLKLQTWDLELLHQLMIVRRDND